MSRMAPASTPRQLWVWSLPSLVILLSLVWYKRKRNTLRSDPGGTSKLLPDTAEAGHQDIEEEDEIPLGLQQSDLTCEPDSTVDHRQLSSADIADLLKGVETTKSEDVEISAVATPVEAVNPIQVAKPPKCDNTLSLSPTGETLSVKSLECDNTLPSPVEEKLVALNCEPLLSAPQEVKCAEIIHQENKSPPETAQKASSPDKMKDTKEVEAAMAPPKEAKDESSKVCALEGKLASLALGSSEEQRRGAERDSANHSPVDAMLASPSMSSYSDEHSEGSSDSGKGCSDVASPPSRTPVGSGSLAGDAEVDNSVESTSNYSVYDFLLPQVLVGRLIGRHGSFVHEIKSKTNASVTIKRHPESTKQKICTIEGTTADIDNALTMIRQRFPINKYPNITLDQISLAPTPTTFPLVPDFCQLHLVEGVNNEVMISSLVSPAHMFVQQPYHPSYQFLQRLNHMMNSIYANVDAPNLPDPIEAGNICVAPAVDGWYRAQVVSTNEESQTSEIKFVDYGGYMPVGNSVLRQIRQDFMTLPFQATECYLANIKPSGESGEWSLEALRIVEELTRGQMLLAQVYDYAADGVPLIYLYSSVNSQVVLINQELVARGMADLDDSAVLSPSSEAASLVVAAKALAAAAAGEPSNSAVKSESMVSSATAVCEDKPKAVESTSELAAN
ncbi:A-kinase anchor protein 1, mitochondrial isoform X2 [Thrips palmi]|uniref:A-kinase anchor protein 1, mitochondrial isoform X2 n=1 Tax=Thrips palmi TaxID=161013 RepID=A0A6P9A4F6_THRPL|nr:A-kinase anchor protein 1, mitochondrial isoform X2 [Thrips palmi]